MYFDALCVPRATPHAAPSNPPCSHCDLSCTSMRSPQEQVFTADILGQPVVDYSALLVTFRGNPATSAADTLRQVGA